MMGRGWFVTGYAVLGVAGLVTAACVAAAVAVSRDGHWGAAAFFLADAAFSAFSFRLAWRLLASDGWWVK